MLKKLYCFSRRCWHCNTGRSPFSGSKRLPSLIKMTMAMTLTSTCEKTVFDGVNLASKVICCTRIDVLIY